METKTALDGHIDIVPGKRGGKPCIAGTRIAVVDVKFRYLREGMSIEQIAGDYHRPIASVYAAMAYHYDHKLEVDQREANDEKFIEEYGQKNPSVYYRVGQSTAP